MKYSFKVPSEDVHFMFLLIFAKENSFPVLRPKTTMPFFFAAQQASVPDAL